MIKPCIVLNRVSKLYGKRKAVSDVTFSVMEGQITAFLGSNGAGKSTTMKLKEYERKGCRTIKDIYMYLLSEDYYL